MNIPNAVINDIPVLRRLVQATYEGDVELLPDPVETDNVDTICDRITENKRAIGPKRKGCHVLQRFKRTNRIHSLFIDLKSSIFE